MCLLRHQEKSKLRYAKESRASNRITWVAGREETSSNKCEYTSSKRRGLLWNL
jgi:hypothetical protein